MDNKFGKISRIQACAAVRDGKTILEDLSFTAPYKIMVPFEKENDGIQIMRLRELWQGIPRNFPIM